MDGQKKTSKVPAPQYIDFVMTWIQQLLNDENTFPIKDGTRTERISDFILYGLHDELANLSPQPFDPFSSNGVLGREFPATFQQTVRAIFKQLTRVFAHVYHSHYDKILSLCQEAHLNALFAHFVSFGREFDLLDKKDIVPMQDLIDTMEYNGILS